MRVLVVEDESQLAELLATGLRGRGMAVDVSLDGADALEKTSINGYDVIVLDRDLPEVTGDEVCRRLERDAAGNPRVIMLTASGTISQRVEGLDLGADDYLPKPFAFDELAARVRALGRRAGPAGPTILARGGLTLDSATLRAEREGRPLDLTLKEFGVLHELLRADGAVVSAEELLERVWDEHADPFTTTVRVTMSRLRRKLGTPSPIETVPGAGYRIS
jgi:DNA-binding response OmpR family regulator